MRGVISGRTNRRQQLASCLGLSVLLAGIGLQPAVANEVTSRTVDPKISQQQVPSEAQSLVSTLAKQGSCVYVASTVITFPGDDATYRLDPASGKVTESPVTATGSDCAAGASLQMSASSAQANAGPAYSRYNKEFSSGDRDYKKTDSNSTFSSHYEPGAKRTVSWDFALSSGLRAIADGPVTTATVDRNGANCHYNKVGATVTYPFHGSCIDHVYSKNYTLTGVFSFPVHVGGNPGTATVNWTFDYIVRSV